MPKILVIEDHEPLRLQVVEMLRAASFEVYDADNGVTGFEMAQGYQPDLILCDTTMEPWDGYQVLEKVRNCPGLCNTPFIFVTAKTDRDSMRKGMTLGADDYIPKPFTPKELFAAIHMRLQRRAALAAEAEQALDEARRRMMHMITHELRTPLTSINMVVDIISRQLTTLPPSQIYELLESLEAGSKRLSRLVDQIVLATQIQAGLFTPTVIRKQGVPMPLWEILVSAISLARRFAYRNPNVDIELNDRDKGALVICNMMALKHALAELIVNALNFSPEGGVISIAEWRTDGTVWVSITDNGQGIEEGMLEQAVKSFEQINRDVQEQQGMGMGLGLANHLIRSHGGTLALHSVAGKGTQVVIGLPQYIDYSVEESVAAHVR